MKGLVQRLKSRAKKVLQRSESTPPIGHIRSPFESGLPDPTGSLVAASNSSVGSKLGEHAEETLRNPLAELTRRASTSDSNPNPNSSSPFPNLCNIEENWKLSSYKRSNSEGTTSTFANKSGHSEGFAFTVPKPVSQEECEELASTLFKWGTIETTKSRDSDNNSSISEDHCPPLSHFSTWTSGQRTPFDPPYKKQLVPFNERSDSAISDYCQEIGSFQLAKEILTLTQLRKHTKKGKGGTVLDLRGTTIKGEGSLVINCPEITIQNGKIELSEGILIKAAGIALIDLQLSTNSSHSSAISIVKKNCLINRCCITNPGGTGVQVSGLGSSLTMRRTTVFDCDRNCVGVSRGAILRINDGCAIRGSRSFHGISASDKETQISLEDSKIYDHFQDAIFLTHGVRAIVESCQVFGSKEYHGVSGKKCGTNLTLKNCQIHSNKESAVIVEQGAKAQLKDCVIRGSKTGHGIVAGSYGSHLEVIDSEVDHCTTGGILIFGSASGRIARTHVHDSDDGNGIVISGAGTSATLMNSVVFYNARNNIYVENGGKLRLDDCDIFSSKRCNGVLARDKGSTVLLSKCNILKNQGCNVGADAGASCTLTDCRVDDPVVGPNLLGRGRQTSIVAVALGGSTSLLRSTVASMRGASVKLNEQKARSRKSWNGLKLNHLLNCKVSFPTA